MNKENVLRKAIDTYGIRAQMRQCIEEMSELTKAICKLQRLQDSGEYKGSEYNKKLDDLIDETADVYIMVRQMCMMLGESNVKARIAYKIGRLEKRLEENK